jgi:hypothetical protein
VFSLIFHLFSLDLLSVHVVDRRQSNDAAGQLARPQPDRGAAAPTNTDLCVLAASSVSMAGAALRGRRSSRGARGRRRQYRGWLQSGRTAATTRRRESSLCAFPRGPCGQKGAAPSVQPRSAQKVPPAVRMAAPRALWVPARYLRFAAPPCRQQAARRVPQTLLLLPMELTSPGARLT